MFVIFISHVASCQHYCGLVQATEAGPNEVQAVSTEGASSLQQWSLQTLKHKRKHDQMRIEILLAQGVVQMNKARQTCN